jgi:hypothetical protein
MPLMPKNNLNPILMKKFVLLLTFLTLFACLYAQKIGSIYNNQYNNGEKYSDTLSYHAPFISSENFIFSSSDFRWRPKTAVSLISYSFNNYGSKLDLLTLNHKFFNIGGLSVINTNSPYFLDYLLPFGFKIPIYNSRFYSISFCNNNYLFPTKNDAPSHTKEFESYSIDGTEGVDLNVDFPKFTDNELRIESNFGIGLSAYIGYRTQLSDYIVTNTSTNNIEYKGNSMGGFYAGVCFSLELLYPNKTRFGRSINIGQEKFKKLKETNSYCSYQDFIINNPDAPLGYTIEANKRKDLRKPIYDTILVRSKKLLIGMSKEEFNKIFKELRITIKQSSYTSDSDTRGDSKITRSEEIITIEGCLTVAFKDNKLINYYCYDSKEKEFTNSKFDEIYQKDGKVISCLITSEDDNTVYFIIKLGDKDISTFQSKSEIENIKYTRHKKK